MGETLGKQNIAGDPYDLHCAKCKTTDNLRMHPQRIEGLMVGWLFLCQGCSREGVYKIMAEMQEAAK